MAKTSYFQAFKTDIQNYELPEKFTFPFYYEPHKLSLLASQELQQYLETQSDFNHNFGLNEAQNGLIIGKMFGVLVCQNSEDQIGYLSAFSGKLAESNEHDKFVPPVYDMLHHSSFYKEQEEKVNVMNRAIEALENSKKYLEAIEKITTTKKEAETDIQNQKNRIKELKKIRDNNRNSIDENLNSLEVTDLLLQFSEESKKESILLKKMTKYWNFQIENAQNELRFFTEEIARFKEIRKVKSASLQQELFSKYLFLNGNKQTKNIGQIFDNNPPAGAGECAAPKLLHYAFQHNLKPIAMAEFWWGQSPNSEIKKHKHFYPACRSKCFPILTHMLEGILVDDNPLLENPSADKDISIVYQDDYLAVISKPEEFLSVPGKNIQDSVYKRVKELYPNATGPLIVHRLDMSTSGLLLIAKSDEIYKALQSQFIKRTIKKRYVAILEGTVKDNEGIINLPLRLDIDNRPYQMVCYEYGKQAQTIWKKISEEDGKTRVHFYPISGRTHQLRVHASHKLGLNAPIVGDDLYGTKANRLHLHAEEITFMHPISKENITIFDEATF